METDFIVDRINKIEECETVEEQIEQLELMKEEAEELYFTSIIEWIEDLLNSVNDDDFINQIEAFRTSMVSFCFTI